jgi:stalled ribosome rescue protein Dom34
VVAELQRSELIVGALVDRVGADIHIVNATEIRRHETVVGEEEFVHKGAPGGWSQHRFQTRAEQVWKRNSGLVARRIAKLLTGNGLRNAVVSGDVRAVGFLLDQLPESVRARVEHVQAGGRHEPASTQRLKEAAKELAIRDEAARRDESLERLRDPRAVIAHGIGQAIEPLMRGTVEVLFVTDRVPPHDWLDFAVQRALEAQAEVVIVPVDQRARIGSGDLACVLRPGPAPSVPVT